MMLWQCFPGMERLQGHMLESTNSQLGKIKLKSLARRKLSSSRHAYEFGKIGGNSKEKITLEIDQIRLVIGVSELKLILV